MVEYKYSKETQQKWGNTVAYQQSATKTANYRKSDWVIINKKASLINSKLANNIDKDIDDVVVQQLVADWQNHITHYYYNCTTEILRGLGEMYVADERFKKYYDDIKPGLAQFFSNAILRYCDNQTK